MTYDELFEEQLAKDPTKELCVAWIVCKGQSYDPVRISRREFLQYMGQYDVANSADLAYLNITDTSIPVLVDVK
jgi:hypothetical protein